jgi:hypothetical protein
MVRNQQLSSDMLKGTLDMMILRTLSTGDAHGHTIAKVIERTSEDVLEVEQGSLYPALHRLEDSGAGSPPTGARAKTTARPSTIDSPPPAAAASPSKPAAGGRWRALSPSSWEKTQAKT